MANSRRVVYMDCPVCGVNVRGVSLIYGKLKIILHNCPDCHKEWHEITLLHSMGMPELIEMLEHTQKRHSRNHSHICRKIIWFLESKIDAMTYEATEEGQRKRKYDLWERQFIAMSTEEAY